MNYEEEFDKEESFNENPMADSLDDIDDVDLENHKDYGFEETEEEGEEY